MENKRNPGKSGCHKGGSNHENARNMAQGGSAGKTNPGKGGHSSGSNHVVAGNKK